MAITHCIGKPFAVDVLQEFCHGCPTLVSVAGTLRSFEARNNPCKGKVSWHHAGDGTCRSRRFHDRPQVRMMEQGDTIATALLRQHLLASGVITSPGGAKRIPKTARGQAHVLRTAGTDTAGQPSVARQMTGSYTTQTSMYGHEEGSETQLTLAHNCLTKGSDLDPSLVSTSEPGAHSVGAGLVWASRQGLPTSMSSILSQGPGLDPSPCVAASQAGGSGSSHGGGTPSSLPCAASCALRRIAIILRMLRPVLR